MKNYSIILFLLSLSITFGSCSDFLDMKPNGVLGQDDVTGKEQVDKLVIAAYSILGNDHYDAPMNLWPFGNVRSDDAYKGGRDEADIQDYHFYEISNNILPTFGIPDATWFNFYMCISRANTALRALAEMPEEDFPMKKVRMAECRFLRAHSYFLLKIMYKYIPYIDETLPVEEYKNVSNVALSNDELWTKIAEDFKAAYDDLPEVQPEVGRANRYAAAAYLAKTYLYKGFRQDEKHNVTGIDADDMRQVVEYTGKVIGSPFRLEPDFANNFLPGSYENGPESLFAIQHSTGDGTLYGRLNFSDVLNVPMTIPGACDFQKPSQNLVNAFKTENGLPMFNTYNNSDFNASADKADPRLFHTVALEGYPYKYDYRTFGADWSRNPGVYGYYSSLKENVNPDDPSSVLIDPFRGNSKNKIVIRYADVLLMRAEALIELNRESEALPLINEVRMRAKNSMAKIPYAAEVADIALYEEGVNCTWTNSFARNAVRWERRLELAMECQRFFDLVRWGIADQVMNTYYKTESTKRAYYENAYFDKNKEEYVPIPQQQINFSKGVYKQNNNY